MKKFMMLLTAFLFSTAMVIAQDSKGCCKQGETCNKECKEMCEKHGCTEGKCNEECKKACKDAGNKDCQKGKCCKTKKDKA